MILTIGHLFKLLEAFKRVELFINGLSRWSFMVLEYIISVPSFCSNGQTEEREEN